MSHNNQGFPRLPPLNVHAAVYHPSATVYMPQVSEYNLGGDQHTTTTSWYAGNQKNQATQGIVFTAKVVESCLQHGPSHEKKKKYVLSFKSYL